MQDNWPMNLLPPKFLGAQKLYSPDPPPFLPRSCWGSGNETKWLLQAIKNQSQRSPGNEAKWVYAPDSYNKCTAWVTSNVETWTVDNQQTTSLWDKHAGLDIIQSHSLHSCMYAGLDVIQSHSLHSCMYAGLDVIQSHWLHSCMYVGLDVIQSHSLHSCMYAGLDVIQSHWLHSCMYAGLDVIQSHSLHTCRTRRYTESLTAHMHVGLTVPLCSLRWHGTLYFQGQQTWNPSW